jgi:hypothetical protein
VPALPGIVVLLRDQSHQMERHFAGATYNEQDTAGRHGGRGGGGVARRDGAAG